MIKPMGVLLVLGGVCALLVCLFLALWGIVYCLHSRRGKAAVLLGIAAVGMAVVSAAAIYAVAPTGGRTIAQLDLADGRGFVLRQYRSGWLEYPKVRFYARDTDGAWTRFTVIAELVNPDTASLVLDAPAQEVEVAGAGWYRIRDIDFVNVDGSRGAMLRLPPGIEPGEESME